MGKITEISPMASKEDRLEQISEQLDELKNIFADVLEEYEADEKDPQTLNALTEALDAMEDAAEIIADVIDGVGI